MFWHGTHLLKRGIVNGLLCESGGERNLFASQ
ncbi:MAG: hypothetical protein ACI89X_001975, partial [Planctomycetota bacterium]